MLFVIAMVLASCTRSKDIAIMLENKGYTVIELLVKDDNYNYAIVQKGNKIGIFEWANMSFRKHYLNENYREYIHWLNVEVVE